jgi:hypothetical protein
LSKNPRLWFGGEGYNNDPRAQTEDLGNNAMLAGEYGIKNLKRIIKNLPEWTKEEGDRYQNLSEMYSEVLGQFSLYNYHVLRNIGGVYETFKSIEEQGNVYEPTPKAVQRLAVQWLQQQLFTTPDWLLDRNILNKISEPILNSVGSIQGNVLSSILNGTRLARMLEAENRFGNRTYSVIELLSDLKKGMWSELNTGRNIGIARRNLQKIYVDRLISLLPSTTTAPGGGFVISFGGINTKNSDVPSIARGHLTNLLANIRAAIGKTTDSLSRYHLLDLQKRIEVALNPKY